MKATNISEALGYIDDSLILEAESAKRNKTPIFKWCALAACLAIAVMAIISYLIKPSPSDPIIPGKDSGDVITPGEDAEHQEPSVSPDPTNRPYKDMQFSTNDEIAYIPTWDEMDVSEQYRSITVNGKIYTTLSSIPHRQMVKPEYVGAFLGVFEGRGYDSYTDTVHTKELEVFQIKNVNTDYLIAVKIEDTYYGFVSENHKNAPLTLGEFMSIYSLESYLSLTGFSIGTSYTSEGYYTVDSDRYIWQALAECNTAEAIETPTPFSLKNKTYVQFTATSDALGFYKKVFTITKDGYVHTNAFNYSYTYKIDTGSAEKIFNHVNRNKEEAQRSQYYYYLIGTVTEVTDDYILVNDAVRCQNPEDGLTFKIMLNTSKLRREVCGVDSIVSIEMIRTLTVEDNLTVDFAVSINRCYIDKNGDAFTEE